LIAKQKILKAEWWLEANATSIVRSFGAVHKRHPQPGWRGSVQCGQGRKGFFRCGRLHILVQKTSRFFKLMVCPHRQRRRGVEPERTFFGEGGNYFAILCGCLLWKAPFVRFQNG